VKDWQPIPMLGAIPVRGRLFCYLGGAETKLVRISASNWEQPNPSLHSTGTCHMAQL